VGSMSGFRRSARVAGLDLEEKRRRVPPGEKQAKIEEERLGGTLNGERQI
jgi:hypothetical protein